MRQLTLASLMVCLLGAAGCGDSSSPASELKIVRGNEVSLTDPVARHTLALVQSASGRLLPYCSAVLVTPDKAITAAHCIQSEEEPVYLALGLGVGEEQNLVVRRGMGVIHPDYATDSEMMTYNDVAVINFTDNLKNPAHMSPVAIATADAFDVGTKVIIAGYGSIGFRDLTGYIPNLSAKLNKTATAISRFDSKNSNLIVYESADGIASACGGDSGGPMFIETPKGELQLIGVTRGPVIDDESSLRCMGRGTYTNVAFLREFVEN